MAGKARRHAGKLMARKVKTTRKIGLIGDGNGLCLKIDPFRYQTRGKPRRHGLGPVHAGSLSDARKRAEAVRGQLLDGVDPIEAKRAAQIAAAVEAAKSVHLRWCGRQYIKAHEAGCKSDKHAKQWKATLSTYASPVFDRLPVSAIDINMVFQALEIWITKMETAGRVRRRHRGDWAKAKRFRSGDNPALWRGGLEHLASAAQAAEREREWQN